MKIAIAGTGYVGLSNAMLLAQHNDVVAIDIDHEKGMMLNHGHSPILDIDIEQFLSRKGLRREFTKLKFHIKMLAGVLMRLPCMLKSYHWTSGMIAVMLFLCCFK
ncbi:hypothetical protein JYT48_02315 [Mariprofundus ferrooxydans]|nr:hypothetical protein [Mariprofundus ferrooxydans]